MIVLGIDPGYATVGYGVIRYEGNKFTVVDYGSIITEAKLPFPRRIKIIYDEIFRMIIQYAVEEIAIEELFFSRNTKTAMAVAHARGAILIACEAQGVPIYEYTPMQVKQGVCGYGGADKKQVQQMVKILLNLSQVPKPDDTADALAIAISHCHASPFSSIFKVK